MGILTPVNDLIVDIVSKAQDNKKVPDFDESMGQFKKLFDTNK